MHATALRMELGADTAPTAEERARDLGNRVHDLIAERREAELRAERAERECSRLRLIIEQMVNEASDVVAVEDGVVYLRNGRAIRRVGALNEAGDGVAVANEEEVPVTGTRAAIAAEAA